MKIKPWSRFAQIPKLLVVMMVTLVGVAAWYGGRERWELPGGQLDRSPDPSVIAAYEKRVSAQPDAAEPKYLLACVYYRQGRYSEAQALWEAVINLPGIEGEIVRKSWFNRGNALFRLAGSTEDLPAAIGLLQQSLESFRTALAMERLEREDGLS